MSLFAHTQRARGVPVAHNNRSHTFFSLPTPKKKAAQTPIIGLESSYRMIVQKNGERVEVERETERERVPLSDPLLTTHHITHTLRQQKQQRYHSAPKGLLYEIYLMLIVS